MRLNINAISGMQLHRIAIRGVSNLEDINFRKQRPWCNDNTHQRAPIILFQSPLRDFKSLLRDIVNTMTHFYLFDALLNILLRIKSIHDLDTICRTYDVSVSFFYSHQKSIAVITAMLQQCKLILISEAVCTM